MKGFYLINTNIENVRAHTHQILKTVGALNSNGINIDVISPRYNKSIDTNRVIDRHNLKNNFEFHLLNSFLFRKPGREGFFLFNVKTRI